MKIDINKVLLWFTLVVSIGTCVTYFDSIHEKYVTHEELELRILQEKNYFLEKDLTNKKSVLGL